MALIPPEYLWTKKYSAKRDRLALEHGGAIQPGVWAAGDYKVIQRAAGANMSVDVAAGSALIRASSPGNLGLYHQQNDATVNVSVTASHASLPRLDQVFVEVNDTTDGGDVSDTSVFTVVAGTPTAGTTLDNRNGAGAVPDNAVRLADILVPAASTTVTTANIRDRRPWARGARALLNKDTSYTISSATYAAVDSTFLRPRVECSGAPLKVRFSANAYGAATTARMVSFRLYQDGIFITRTTRNARVADGGTVAIYQPVNLIYGPISPTPGSHTFEIFWRAANALAVNLEGSGEDDTQTQIEVWESVQQLTSND